MSAPKGVAADLEEFKAARKCFHDSISSNAALFRRLSVESEDYLIDHFLQLRGWFADAAESIDFIHSRMIDLEDVVLGTGKAPSLAGVTLRQLAIVVAGVEEKTLSEAAAQFGLTRDGYLRHLMALERKGLTCRLRRCVYRNWTLTSHGKQVKRYLDKHRKTVGRRTSRPWWEPALTQPFDQLPEKHREGKA